MMKCVLWILRANVFNLVYSHLKYQKKKHRFKSETLNIHRRIFLFLLIASMSILVCNAQGNPLEELKWKNRILLLLHESESNDTYREQLTALGKIDANYDDRRLIVIDVQKQRFQIRNKIELDWRRNNWISNETLYAKYAFKKANFTVVLIGLDGGIKLQQTEVLQIQELFDVIDAMPMRSAELKRKY